MTKKDSKSVFKEIKELKQTEKGKAILFFGGYLIFFIAVFLIIGFGRGREFNIEDYETNSSDVYLVESIFNNNYKFTYTIIIDNNLTVYSGDKYFDNELFTVNGIKYYRNGDNYFMNNNGKWEVSTNPYIYTDFLNFERLGQVLVDASFISKTEFGDGTKNYNYQISSNSLNKIIEDINTDILEVPNSVTFRAQKDNNLDKAELDLTSYGKYKGICTNNFKIILEYSHFGEIGELSNPIEGS